MKDSEFIELLNLYIDHEISAADVGRLESEVLAHPGRRRIYQQYCRMHRACGILATQFKEGAPEAALIFRPRRPVWVGAAYATGLMAAAGFAVLVGIRQHQGVNQNAAANQNVAEAARLSSDAAPSAPAALVAQANPAPAQSVATQLQPVVDLRDLNLFAPDSARNVRFPAGSNAATLAAEQAQAQQINSLFAWMNQVRVQPVQRPQLEQAFDATPVLLTPDSRSVTSSPYGDAQVEKAAFRFER